MTQNKRNEPTKKRGRPATGKRSNDDYSQHSVWLPKELYAGVLRNAVTPDGKRYEFSALVESLLQHWLERGAKLPKREANR